MEMPDSSRAQWRTSSYSGGNGACVEVAVAWRTSSHSGSNGDCVEVGADPAARVLVRDTRDREGLVLAFRPAAWRRFARQVKAGPRPG
jgi:hypothetical protein